ncbi:nickel ABC transporter permease [Natranaerobius thermophilus]|uniref:Nickel import system permease protein NikB n=1 Tax=Natranaerobius thermophilus (strain ATCC BAA-1301 / DSM 18059 / JW/NM-WN-LF) TaxID=457570 RepID=B2A0T9_NATTJ|nr:nickel ABC transporter permease [Natranaerobius thermophilus]ACB85969.1 binding-protein-dependent transport systems inner membrane component [Natranaerobius thermophilus JW/NM-WN-LF]
MHKYIFNRLLQLIPVLLGVVFIVFTIMYITPGDPALILLGEQAPEHQVKQLRREMGLHLPFFQQFLNYLTDVIQGDFGYSLTTGRPVLVEIMARFPNTLVLSTGAIFLAVIIGIPAGIISAVRQNSAIDNVTMVGALLGVSLPNFWQGMMAILLFSVLFPIFPSSGFDTWQHAVLPIVTLGTSSAGLITRMTRSSMLEVLRQDYIRTAKAKGLNERTVIVKHALKNALIPVVTVIGLQFGFLLGGAVLTETIFSIPGLGRLIVDSIREQNFTVVQGGVLFIAIVFSLVNLLVDIFYAFLDPRIKAQYQ